MNRLKKFITWTVVVIYVGGYWVYLIAAGITSWDKIPTLYTWYRYMVAQVFYGLLWPLWLFL